MIESLIKKELILKDVKVSNKEELITLMANKMKEGGYVKDTYLENLLKRENKYPTGLDTGELKVAIPHTDAVNVNEAAICVAKLAEPIEFQDMGDPSKALNINLVFMLAVKDPQKQVPVLTQLMSIFSDKERLQELFESETEEKMFEIIEQLLK